MKLTEYTKRHFPIDFFPRSNSSSANYKSPHSIHSFAKECSLLELRGAKERKAITQKAERISMLERQELMTPQNITKINFYDPLKTCNKTKQQENCINKRKENLVLLHQLSNMISECQYNKKVEKSKYKKHETIDSVQNASLMSSQSASFLERQKTIEDTSKINKEKKFLFLPKNYQLQGTKQEVLIQLHFPLVHSPGAFHPMTVKPNINCPAIPEKKYLLLPNSALILPNLNILSPKSLKMASATPSPKFYHTKSQIQTQDNGKVEMTSRNTIKLKLSDEIPNITFGKDTNI